jgi:hypothetical protein
VSACCGDGIPSCERMFDRRTADDDLRRLRKDGPPWATRTLLEGLAEGIDLAEATVIDIGAGVGAVHLGLLERGARSATDLDGSSAYLDAARDEAGRRGLGERVRHVLGDATVVGESLEPADIVALDRVVCCYGGLPALLGVASSLARRRLGLVYPRDAWWMRAGVALSNPTLFRGSAGYRMHVHRVSLISSLLHDAGFAPLGVRAGRVWRVETWERLAPLSR